MQPVSSSGQSFSRTQVEYLEAPQKEALPRLIYTNPTASPWVHSPLRRGLDFAVAALLLGLMALPMLLISILVRLSSEGPVLFVQWRVGMEGRLFRIYKFRSMHLSAHDESGVGLTRDGDCRLTVVGRLMRRFKLDELPQLLNILRGEMSLVGPRPVLPRYSAIFNMPYRPGLTGAATLAFRGEERLLSRIHPSMVEEFYKSQIGPLKARMDVRYMCRATLLSDLRLLAATSLACLRREGDSILMAELMEQKKPVASLSRESGEGSWETVA